jgi:hypothetical protein
MKKESEKGLVEVLVTLSIEDVRCLDFLVKRGVALTIEEVASKAIHAYTKYVIKRHIESLR